MEGELLDNDHPTDDHHPAGNCPLSDDHLIGDNSSYQCWIQNPPRKGYNPWCDHHWLEPYLILVTTATTGGGVPFSSRRTFFHRERERDCFHQSLFKDYKHKVAHFLWWSTLKKYQLHQTTHQVRQLKHQVRQTNHQLCQRKHQVRQTKNTVLSLGNFCREFTHFLAYLLEA